MKNRSRIALLIGALFILGTGSITAYQSMSNTIAIVDDGKVTQYETLDLYVGDVLNSQDIELGDKDSVYPSIDSKIEDGTKIVIERWIPIVNLMINGETNTFKTQAKTVEEDLASKKVKLTETSEVSLPLDQETRAGLTIIVKTEEIITEVIQEEIPFETIVETTKDLGPGETKVITEGVNGVKESVVEIVRFGGEAISHTVKNEEVVMEPQAEVIQEGIKNTIKDAKSGKTYEYSKALTLNASAYTCIPGDRWEGKTASGMPTFVGMVAVDPNVIPLEIGRAS